MQLEWDNSTNGCPGSDASGNPVPSQPNYDTPAISLSPSQGYATAPFKIEGLFFSAGDSTSSSLADAGTTSALPSSKADASGRFSVLTRIPGKSKPGTATVTSTGGSGKATSTLTVLSQ